MDATLTADQPFGGNALTGTINARYLFGATMGKRPVRWALTRSPMYNAPPAVADKFPFDSLRLRRLLRADDDRRTFDEQIAARSAELDANGELRLTLDSRSGNGIPYQYSLEGDVEDVSRQHIANRASLTVHPARFYIGLRRPTLFVEQRTGLNTAVVAVTPDGEPVPNVSVDVRLTQVQWNSVRRAEGYGFYTWETERKEVEVGRYTVATGAQPAPLTCRPSRAALRPEGRGARRRRARGVDDAVVLRDRTRLHGVAAVRPQPDRAACPSARPTSRATPRRS